MIGKRCAVLAVFSAVLAKLAHADEPPTNNLRLDGPFVSMWKGPPTTWTVNLDSMKQIDVRLGDERVTISREELFAALKG
jgi:hypothetical protein